PPHLHSFPTRRSSDLGPVPFGVHDHWLVQYPDTPLESGADVVVAGLELQAEHLLHRTADHVQIAQPGELARPAAGADQPALLVRSEEHTSELQSPDHL